jgi:outer membrane lipoprotein carrier protein
MTPLRQNLLIVTLSLLAAIAAPAQTVAPLPAAATLAKKVDAHYNHLQSLQARYTERYRGMGIDRTETGTLLLRKPGRMRWSYDDPAGKVFVLDGKFAISYTPGDAQADRIPARQLDDLQSPLRFLLGHADLNRELEGLTLTPVMLNNAPAYTLSGTPKGLQARVRLLSLTVDANGIIHAMRIEEADGATTDFSFTDLHENVPAPDTDFTFTPPPGVTVVNGAAPI